MRGVDDETKRAIRLRLVLPHEKVVVRRSERTSR